MADGGLNPFDLLNRRSSNLVERRNRVSRYRVKRADVQGFRAFRFARTYPRVVRACASSSSDFPHLAARCCESVLKISLAAGLGTRLETRRAFRATCRPEAAGLALADRPFHPLQPIPGGTP